jgi:PAS domain S-box-containing protein
LYPKPLLIIFTGAEMKEQQKTNEQLSAEIEQLREKVSQLELIEKKYYELFENSPVGIFQSTPAGRFRLVNPAFAHMLGYAHADDLVNGIQKITSLYVDPHERDTLMGLFETKGRLNGHVIRLYHQNGEIRWVSVFAQCVYDESGGIKYYDGFTFDITEKKRTEDELRYKAILLDSISDAVITTDTNFTIQGWNQAAENLYGWRREEVVGQPMNKLVPTDYINLTRDAVLAAFQTNDSWQGEVTQSHKDGSPRQILASVNLVRDENGRPHAVLAINRDITQLKQAETTKNELLEQLELAVGTAKLGVWQLDIDANKLEWNDEQLKIYGLSRSEFEENLDAWKSQVHPEDKDYANARLEEAFLGKKVTNVEFRIIQPNGQIRHIDATATPFFNQEGTLTKLIGINQDITSAKKDQEILRQSAEHFKALFDQSPVAIELFNADGLLIDANRKCLELFGVKDIQHVVGFKLFNDPNIPVDEIKQLKQGKQISFTSEFDFEIVKERMLYPTSKSGKMFWEVFIKALLNEAGSIMGYVVQVLDITKRKMAEDQYRAFFTENVSPVYWLEMKKPVPIDLPVGDQVDAIFQEAYFKDVNDRAARMYGFDTRDAVIGKPLTTVYNRESTEQGHSIHLSFENYIRNGYIDKNTESSELTQAGNQKWFLNNSRGIVENGRLVRILGSQIDITERKLAEVALKESEARYKSVISALSEGLVVHDKTDKIVMCNHSAAKILGLTVNQLMGKDSYDPRWQALDKEGQPFLPEEHPSMITLRTGQAVDGSIMNVRVGEENRAIISINSRPILDENQQVIGAVATFTDVTERREAEVRQKKMARQLQDQAHQLQLVMDSVPEGVLVIDASDRVLLANITAKEELNLLTGEMQLGDQITRIGNHLLYEILSPPPKGLWHQIDYENRKFEIIAKPLNNNGGSEGWVIVIHDSTEEWRVENLIQQQERLVTVGQLAAGIAHDFNNILAVITLYSDLSLLDGRLQPDFRKRYEIIKQQSLRATDLIKQILDFGRRSVMQKIDLDLIPFINELITLFDRTLPENIVTSLQYEPDNYFIQGDPAQLQQVFMNLVLNARDAMSEGGNILIKLYHFQLTEHKTAPHPELARRLLTNNPQTEWICITVEDNGPGIAPNVLPHILEPFFTTKEVGKGSGMGLSQVFGIIKQHEGEMDIKTKMGDGTSFLLYLPAFHNNESISQTANKETFALGQGQTILVVEDNPNIRQAIITSLTELNYNLLAAKDGLEALNIFKEKEKKIDLILTDLVMPRMGGQMMVKAIKKAGYSPKVVIMTGHPMDEEKEALVALGIAGWLDKPPGLAKLAQVVATALA